MKEFNTTAVCIPSKHYMVDLSERVKEIKKLIDAGKYFTINRARQYGKTTTINELERCLQHEYDVISIDFQDITDADFDNESDFTKGLAGVLCDAKDSMDNPIPDEYYNDLSYLSEEDKEIKLNDIFRVFNKWCKTNEKKIVLIIDEVDTATNNQVFFDFLAKLRSNYLKHEKNQNFITFQSVILAGVTDVKHLKSKIRSDDEHKVNSPWNIAADFNIDMSLSEEGIKGMLDEYEADHHTGMDTSEIACLIRDYTQGYPFLVSKICQIVDTSEVMSEKFSCLSERWTKYGIDDAVRLLLKESNITLFESLMGKLTNYPELKKKLRRILMNGEVLEYLPYDEAQSQLRMYGFIREYHNTIVISNRIFETLLYNHFLGENVDDNEIKQSASLDRNRFVKNGKLDMPFIMERFIEAYNQIYGENAETFAEKDGRERFLLYLKPIINGTGNYYIEAQTRDQKRTDIIVDYLGQQYIIELKIWRGERYNADGEKQISEYLDYWKLDTGYMLSFNFNMKKEQGVKRVQIGDKVLFEGTV